MRLRVEKLTRQIFPLKRRALAPSACIFHKNSVCGLKLKLFEFFLSKACKWGQEQIFNQVSRKAKCFLIKSPDSSTGFCCMLDLKIDPSYKLQRKKNKKVSASAHKSNFCEKCEGQQKPCLNEILKLQVPITRTEPIVQNFNLLRALASLRFMKLLI